MFPVLFFFFVCALQCIERTAALNVAVIYTSDSKDATKTLAQSIANGAENAGASVRLLLASEASFDRDIREWSDAIALGSGVYNGNPQPEMLEFIDSFDFSADLSGMVGTSFVTSGSPFAGAQPVTEALNRAMMTFRMILVGDDEWKYAEGVISVNDESSVDSVFVSAEMQGERLVRVTSTILSGSPIPTPPRFPFRWTARAISSYTMQGYDGGTLDIVFANDCPNGDPSKQRIYTRYPDNYTVVTRCDLEFSFVISPNSRSGTCETWPIREETCASCACPFCLRDGAADGSWASSGVTWESVKNARRFEGTRGEGDNVSYAVTTNHMPMEFSIASEKWMSVSTRFVNVSTDLDSSLFDAPTICAAGSRHLRRRSLLPSHPTIRTETVSPPMKTLLSHAMPVPRLAPQYRADIVTNISQSGYMGGSVFTSIVADCSSGPSSQVAKTIYGNFHTVHVDCKRRVVYDYDLGGANCRTTPMISLDPRVCETCALPFGMRDSNGTWPSDISWSSPLFTDSGDRGTVLYIGESMAGMSLKYYFRADGAPSQAIFAEDGWLKTSLGFTSYSTSNISQSDFLLPPCFLPSE